MAHSVLVVDDQELVAEGLVLLLDADPALRVVGHAGSADGAVAAARERRPDVVVLDVRMPGRDGIEVVRDLVADGCAVLMLTSYDDIDAVRRSLAAGATGFLLKDNAPAVLCEAVRAVALGEGWLDPSVTRPLLSALARRPADEDAAARVATLTARERAVLTLLAAGRSNREIGAELFVAESTVKTHVTAVLRRLGVRDRVQAAVVAVRAGLLEDA